MLSGAGVSGSSSAQILSGLRDNLRWAYMNSPINFSTLTGYRFPHISRLMGHWAKGRLDESSRDHGLGSSEDIVIHGANLAKQDPRGMCYWWIANQLIILVTNPNDLDQIFFKNKDKVSRAALVKDSLGVILGHDSLLTMPSNDLWRKKRNTVKGEVFNEQPLITLALAMQTIINEHLAALPVGGSVDLRKFSTALPLDVMARTQIGAGSLGKSAEAISKSFEEIFAQTQDNGNIIRQRKAALADFFHLRSKATPLEKARDELYQMLRDHVLKPYGEQIQQGDNLITKLIKLVEAQEQGVPIKLDTPPKLSELGFLLLAGHDTTSRLLEHTLMLLETHPDVLRRLTAEIYEHRPATEVWTREDVEQLTYLKMVLHETLRLYPSIPIFGRTVTDSFVLADIPRTTNQENYQKAMQARDVTRDVRLEKGDIILISPFVTHRLEKQFENPLVFDPTRFEKKMDSCAWFPFGLGERDCVGRRFALQEAGLILINIILKYTFSIEEKIQHPFPEIMLGILKPKSPVHMFFKPRDERNGHSERSCHSERSEESTQKTLNSAQDDMSVKVQL